MDWFPGCRSAPYEIWQGYRCYSCWNRNGNYYYVPAFLWAFRSPLRLIKNLPYPQHCRYGRIFLFYFLISEIESHFRRLAVLTGLPGQYNSGSRVKKRIYYSSFPYRVTSLVRYSYLSLASASFLANSFAALSGFFIARDA